ncbi:hypothetical protein EC609_14790 [Achromobacter denitrificans]|nr:hypothetical protein EC609_14790 [Achromobacter denitrificans]
MRKIINDNSATGFRLQKFGEALRTTPPKLARTNQLIFLCGANKSFGEVSMRRSAVKKFISSLSKNYTVLYAEGIFNELRKFENQKNALDLEHWISEIADKVVIILESESAFCELGAFSHRELRHKLVVINNSAFEDSQSFINTGPIAAIKEAKAPVIWYPMNRDGIKTQDGIGATFSDLKSAISALPPDRTPIEFKTLSELSANKISLYFLHDIVVLCSPVTHEEIILILKKIFDHSNLDTVKNLLGVLREAKLIRTKKIDGKWLYAPTSVEMFLTYQFNVHALMAAFRSHHVRFNRDRFSEEQSTIE